MKIESPTTTAAADAAPKTGMAGTTDEFLKLFMAQLQYQDPFDPKNGSDMVAQLAQLTAVEQTRQTNTQLADLAAAQASTASAGLAGLVGRTCDAAAGAFQLDKGTIPPLEVSSTGPIKGGAIVITDATGKELRRIEIPDGARDATITWDGKDASGKPIAPGVYAVSVETGTSSAPIEASWHASVDAVELTPDGPRLRLGGLLVAPGAIRTIGTLGSPTISPYSPYSPSTATTPSSLTPSLSSLGLTT